MLNKFIENYCKVNGITSYVLKPIKKNVVNSGTGLNETIQLAQNEVMFFKKAVLWSNQAFSQHNYFTIKSDSGTDELRLDSEIVFYDSTGNTTQKKYETLIQAHKGNVNINVVLPTGGGPYFLTGIVELIILRNLTQPITTKC